MKPRFVKQRYKNDCAIAAIAMVVDKPYTAVRRIIVGPIHQGLDDHEMLWIIRHFGSWRLVLPKKDWTLESWSKKYPLCVVSYGWLFYDTCHAAAIVNGKLLNPANQFDTDMAKQYVLTSIVPCKS